MKTNKKSGFTLIELMVVAIIVAILAAVAIPLMSANKDRAVATEAQAGISALMTASKIYYTEFGTIADKDTLETSNYIEKGDLAGKYFDYDSYELADLDYDETAGFSGTLTATTKSGVSPALTVEMTFPTGDWSYVK
jgi:prepilin-type N-terminal cleavage/methylation domain-containing protein